MAEENKDRFMLIRKLGPLLGLLLICGVLTVLSDRFLTVSNAFNVIRQVSINAIISVGMTLVILTGGIDLSVGSIVAFCGSITAGLLASGQPLLLAVPAGLIAGAGWGFVNGLLITKADIPPFIATLGTMTAARGFTLVYTGGMPISGMNEAFQFIGGGYIGTIPVPIVIMVAVFILAYIMLRRTRFGRYIYAIGGNEEASRLSGIHTKKILASVYTLGGLLAGLSGIILASRLDSAQPTAGMGFELDAIAAVVLGGTSLSGGVGTVGGTLIGALVIGVLDNGLNLLDVSSFYQQVAKGAVILLAVFLDKKRKQGG
jgi:ribose/xylose/arabinose/galactoside ABC-type transport system permease subunit